MLFGSSGQIHLWRPNKNWYSPNAGQRIWSNRFTVLWNFAVKSVAGDNKERCSTVSREPILKLFYTDDLLKSVIAAEEALNLAKDNFDVLQHGGFGWQSLS